MTLLKPSPIKKPSKETHKGKNLDMNRIATVILGGGCGTRLFPLTQTCCKPAISFGGRFRLVDIPISNALNSGCNKIYIISQFLSTSLHYHIIKTYRMENFSRGFIKLLSAEQKPCKSDWFQGTADAVRQNVEYLMETSADYVLILSGDQLYQMSFQPMLDLALEKDADLVIASLPVEPKEASRLGILKLDSDHSVADFIEKPQKSADLNVFRNPLFDMDTPFAASMGIYLFKKEALFELLKEDVREDFGKHLIPTQVKKGGVYSFIHDNYWEDIGTIESFYRANLLLTEPHSPINFYSAENPIYSLDQGLPPAKIFDAHLSHSIVSDGAVVNAAEIQNSLIGPRSVVGKGCIISDSYIMGHDHYCDPNSHTYLSIGENCHIKKAIIDKNVRLGNDVKLINTKNLSHYDGEMFFIRDGIIIVPRGAFLPDGFVI